MSDRLMQIGEVAQRTELSIRTVRHYDDVGLVVPSERSSGGFRLYTENDIQRLLVIRRMKPLGFTLADMKDLLDAIDTLADPSATSAGRDSAAESIARCRSQLHTAVERLKKHLDYAEELDQVLAAAD